MHRKLVRVVARITTYLANSLRSKIRCCKSCLCEHWRCLLPACFKKKAGTCHFSFDAFGGRERKSIQFFTRRLFSLSCVNCNVLSSESLFSKALGVWVFTRATERGPRCKFGLVFYFFSDPKSWFLRNRVTTHSPPPTPPPPPPPFLSESTFGPVRILLFQNGYVTVRVWLHALGQQASFDIGISRRGGKSSRCLAFFFLLLFYCFRGNQVLLQFLSNELALSCDDLCFYFHRSLCRSGTLSLILTASQLIAKKPCTAGRWYAVWLSSFSFFEF